MKKCTIDIKGYRFIGPWVCPLLLVMFYTVTLGLMHLFHPKKVSVSGIHVRYKKWQEIQFLYWFFSLYINWSFVFEYGFFYRSFDLSRHPTVMSS